MGKTRALRGLGNSAKGKIAEGARRVLPKAKAARFSKKLNQNWQDTEYDVGVKKFDLDDEGMDHILKCHHPKYWEGSTKKKQSFFDKDMSVEEVKDAITTVMRQNRGLLERNGTDATYQMEGVVNGVRYKIGIKNGKIDREVLPHVVEAVDDSHRELSSQRRRHVHGHRRR